MKSPFPNPSPQGRGVADACYRALRLPSLVRRGRGRGFFLLLLFCPFITFGQEITNELTDSLAIIPQQENGLLPDSIPQPLDSVRHRNLDHIQAPVLEIDTTKKINYWHITGRTGEIIPFRPDTFLTDYFNRTNVEGQSVAMAYLGNLGLPGESRVFFEREDRSQFIFLDPYSAYLKTPGKFNFINTKIPHSNLSYQQAGSKNVQEQRLQAVLAINIGKKLNLGFDADYLYARGYYKSQSAKHLNWVFFGNYLSDRHQLHVFINPFEFTNAENGGITDDDYISHPDRLDSRKMSSRDIPTYLSSNDNTTWNSIKGKQAYLNYHYNLGFERETEYEDEEGNKIRQFIPVSSIIYTFDYKDSRKNFYTSDSTLVDKYYKNVDHFNNGRKVNDSTSYWSLSNTFALSMREGFSEWAKFDLTAFLTEDVRSFTLMDRTNIPNDSTLWATYIGGELAKRTGEILRYNAQGSFGVLGDNLGDVNLSGNIETRIPVWGDTASIKASASIKNLAPTFYENHYHSKYFWWDKNFGKVKKQWIGGTIDIPHTKTRFSLGVENVSNYIYFDEKGYPQQHGSDIQITTARLDQNFKFKALHWDNQLVYQSSSNDSILPLPQFAAYSSLYIQFKIAKVLTIQMGANVHYWTKYYAPAYEPATQQFKLQREVEVGNYPLISGFLNCHLKQTRFFVEYYNAGAKFISSPPNYFSLPHYPVNPTILKLGLSVDFIN
ncbi:MAG: putative porin [Candidatus Symbiothrix sp.]|jgi:hypothetical protein|nr:putative porin [Candidatus Symbiothrix sp.]